MEPAFTGTRCCTTVASGFIRDYNMPNIAGITPIHFFTGFVAFQLPRGIWFIRQGNVVQHRKTMRGLYQGGCLLAGVVSEDRRPVLAAAVRALPVALGGVVHHREEHLQQLRKADP